MDENRPEMDIARMVAEHHRGVYGYAYRLTGSVADAEDLTQQVFLTAQQKLSQLRNPNSARTWLFSILRHCFLKGCQKRRPLLAGSVPFNLDTIPEEIPSADQIDRDQLQDALGQLPEKYRIVLAMFYYENYSYREIAELLDLPIGTVMSRLARAKGFLRSKLFGLAQSSHPVRYAKTASHQGY